jgi:hypothetical protein
MFGCAEKDEFSVNNNERRKRKMAKTRCMLHEREVRVNVAHRGDENIEKPETKNSLKHCPLDALRSSATKRTAWRRLFVKEVTRSRVAEFSRSKRLATSANKSSRAYLTVF